MVWADVHKPTRFRIRWKFSALGRQIVVAVLLASILFAAAISAVHVWADHRQETQRAVGLTEQATQRLVPLFAGDAPDLSVINDVLAGIAAHPRVYGIELGLKDGTRLQHGAPKRDDRNLSLAADLTTFVGDGVSYMTLVSVSPTLGWRIRRDANSYFVAEMTRILVIGMVMLVIFDRIAARHLRTIAQQVRSTHWMDSQTPMALDRDVGVFPDEIDSIINALETMRGQAQGAYASVSSQAAEMRALNRSLKAANREQQELTYALSHDLIAPMNTVDMVLGELGETSSLTAVDRQQMIADLRASTQRMRQQIESVQHFARLHKRTFDVAPVNLDAVMVRVLEHLSEQINDADANLHVGVLGWVMGDADTLEDLFTQLVRNSLQYRDANRNLSIRIHADQVTSAEALTVHVKDTGIGIAAKYHDHVFGLFRRLHTHGDIPGHGMGLPMAQRIVALHGGTIDLQSDPGVGTTLSITLPGA